MEKVIDLKNSVSADSKIIGDVETINIVMRNIISNAVKFSPEKSRVTIVEEKGNSGETVICVHDQGKGIEQEVLDTLFDINRKSVEDSGTGLGLILSKEFMERNRGKLEVFSEEGVGTVVKMYLGPKAESG